MENLDPFYSLIFQSALAISAILFGVFGFLYAVFAQLVVLQDPPPILIYLKFLCQAVATLVTISFFLAAYSLSCLIPFATSMQNISYNRTILCAGILLIGAGSSSICLWIAFRAMRQ
jgi:hypothetical protein